MNNKKTKNTNKNNKSNKTNKNVISREDSLKNIFQTKEKDIIDIEYNSLTQDYSSENFLNLQPFILSKYIQSKFLNIKSNYELINNYLNESESHKLNLKDYLDLKELRNAQEYMIKKLNLNLKSCKDLLNEDMKKLSFLKKKRDFDSINEKKKEYSSSDGFIDEQQINTKLNNKKNLIKEENFKEDEYHYFDNFENVTNEKQRKINQELSESNNKINRNSIEKEGPSLKLKISYAGANDSYPQFLTFKTKEFSDFGKFLTVLKKKLGIYEFAKFKLVFIYNGTECYFLNSVNQFFLDRINEIKVVPEDYIIGYGKE